jgi:hypothetical protein
MHCEGMDVVQCFDHLVGEQSYLLSFKFTIGMELQHIQQSVLHQFKDHEQLGLMLECVQKADYVGVALNQL